jgi:pimeloyl-[acyl-carrier protein] synthase
LNNTQKSAIPDLMKVSQIGDGILSTLNELREATPIAWNPGVGVWMVLRHEDVLAGFQGKYPLSNHNLEGRMLNSVPEDEQAAAIPNVLSSINNWMLNMDAPGHTRIRRIMMQGLKPKIVEQVRPFVRAAIADVLDKALQHETVDVVEDIARPITGRTIMQLIGVPDKYLPKMEEWANASTASFTAAKPSSRETVEATERAFSEMRDVFETEIDKRRKNPTDDFMSELVALEEAGEQLSMDELVAQLNLLLIAGHESTTNTLALGLAALIRDASARNWMLSNPDRIADGVAEIMRFVAMSGAMPRVASADFEWHGNHIKRGDNVFLMIASANRDPRVFTDPGVFDPNRPNDRSLVFGPGLHHCIGHLLAKMEAAEFFPAILKRFPDMKMLDRELEFTPGLFFRGLTKLRVKLQ